MSTLAVEVSGEKVKEMWDKRLTEILCDICIKEILKGNRSGKAYSQRPLKNRWDALKKSWKAWKKLKGRDISLGWNPIKRIIDASDDWQESRIKVVPEAQKFRTPSIGLEFKGKLDQMFIEVVAIGDKTWTPSSGTLRSEFFEDVNNDIPEENKE
ncbi:hypothetical protein Gogos_019801 [Gossypium gossypioides]|uniref:Myb/SANT-like domain-containing protein n=2 Tax=Gossypium gossypioides TaxID=34282 RepID=A0A7J9CYT6_GOSGO|nr:hypothetical protein [Gossypium gossypioides]